MENIVIVILVVLTVICSMATGGLIVKEHYKDVDYYITLDHYNVKFENKKGEVVYFNHVDSITPHIHKINL